MRVKKECVFNDSPYTHFSRIRIQWVVFIEKALVFSDDYTSSARDTKIQRLDVLS